MSDETPTPEKRSAPWKGRPRSDNPRNAWVHVRVTADERAKLDEAAERAGLELGPYVVQAALGAPRPRQRRRLQLDRRDLAALLGQLGTAGGNLNQLAKIANQTGQLPAAEALATVLLDIRTAARAISATLRGQKIDAEEPQPPAEAADA